MRRFRLRPTSRLRSLSAALVAAWLSAVCGLSGAAEPRAPAGTPHDALSSGPAVQFRAFNSEDFALAYEAMLGAGNQARAYAIAQQAVAQAPQDRTWRARLAQVAEWTSHLEVAAQQWSALFYMGDRSDATLDALIRLSGVLDDPRLALQIWTVKAATVSLTADQWESIATLYELLAEPAQGSQFFETQFRRLQDPQLLEIAARMADHDGDQELAVRLFRERTAMEPLRVASVMEAAVRMIRMDQLEQALDLMLKTAPRIDQSSTEFWTLLGQLAWNLNDVESAEKVYQLLAQSAQATSNDWSRLVLLVRRKRPQEAAALALQAYQRWNTLDALLEALDIYATVGDDAGFGRALELLSGAGLEEAKLSSSFLQVRASFYRRTQQPELAWADLQRAVALDPSDEGAVGGSLWFLIDQKRLPELGRLLHAYEAQAREKPAYWLAFAAGTQLLGQGRQALYWYSKQLQTQADDPMLLLNYADAVQMVGRTGMAARVRHHAWQMLRKTYGGLAQAVVLERTPELLTVSRMAMENSPGDAAQRVVRKLVQALQSPQGAAVDRDVATLVLGWALGSGQTDNARQWMWQRFADHSSNQAPLWAQAQLALQFKDEAQMQSLLANQSKDLPVSSRYDMAMTLGRAHEALEVASAALDKGEEVQAMTERMRQYVTTRANYLQAGLDQEAIGTQTDLRGESAALQTQTVQVQARVQLSDQLQLTLDAARLLQVPSNPQFADPLPDSNHVTGGQLRWLREDGSSALSVFERNALLHLAGFSLEHTQRWDERWDFSAGLDVGAHSKLSLPLRLGGYENDVYGSVGYALNQREYLRLSPRLSQYYSPDGQPWGGASALDVEAGYRLRLDYPDWRMRLIASTLQTHDANNLGTFYIPQSASGLTACLDMGSSIASDQASGPYNPRWRPFADACLSHNNLGAGTWASGLGLVGSVIGRDQLFLELRNTEDSSATGVPTRTLSVRYRMYF